MTRARTFPFGACLAWLLSAAPFALPESALAGASRTSLAALPWIAYATLPARPTFARPRGSSERVEATHVLATGSSSADLAPAPSAWSARAVEWAWFAPSLALGAWIDLGQGLARADVLARVLTSVIVCAIFAAAATLAARTRRARLAYAVGWFAFVALGPLLEGALVLGGAPSFGAAPRWVEMLAGASPLSFGVAQLDADASYAPPVAAALVGLALLGVGAVPRADDPRARGSSDRASGESNGEVAS